MSGRAAGADSSYVKNLGPFRLAVALLAVLALASVAGAQPIAQIRIGTRPEGAKFRVDGVEYQSTQTFLWPSGSKHTVLIFSNQIGTVVGRRLGFNGWTAQTAAGPVDLGTNTEIVVTADSSIREIIGGITSEVLLKVLFASCPDPTVQCASSNGRVTVNGSIFFGETDVWVPADSNANIQAQPLPGFVFSGWAGAAPGQERMPFLILPMDRPRTLRAFFDGAARVSLRTIPEGLSVLVDRSSQITPAEVDWAMGVPKVLGASSPQRDEFGGLWVFEGFDNGLPKGQNVTYTPALGNNNQQILTARFSPGAAITFATQPPGLRLRLDGQEIFDRNYSQFRAIDSEVTVEAPAEQRDSNGRVYTFVGWSNNGTATQRLLVTRAGLNLTANYRLMPRVILESIPAGQTVSVDGRTCRTPCTLDRERDSRSSLSAPLVIPQTELTRLEFAGWTDGGDAERSLLFDADLKRIAVRYETAHRISLRAMPASAGSFTFDPPSPDGFFRTNTAVTVSANGRPGFRFRRWEGDLQGTFPSSIINVGSSRVATAMFDVVPFTDPNGVQNAAGKTPLPGVAPGSAAAIIGLNLAANLETGPASPLAQTLGGVVVRLGSRMLPLFWVSSERIEFQVPSDLEAGRYRLTVQRSGQPDGEAEMEVVPNNPAIYTRDDVTIEGRPAVGVFLRPNGSRVGPGNPARVGETVTALATGAGRYDLRLPDGFAAPGDFPFRLADPLEVLYGADQVLQPEFAGAYGSLVGVNAIRFRIPEVPAGVLEVRVRVGGRESNAVSLPIE